MVIEETFHGMRKDTFLPSSPIIPEESKQPWKTEKEKQIIHDMMLDVLKHKNKLPK